MRSKSLVAGLAVLFTLVGLSVPDHVSAKKVETFLASDDAKKSDEPQGFLPDYSRLVEGKDADWVYFPNGSLKSFKRVKISPFSSNAMDPHGRHVALFAHDSLRYWLLKQGFQVVDSDQVDMVIEGNIFIAWEPSTSARHWGPGAGEEVICKDSTGQILGFVRHRSLGSTIVEAVENGLEEIAKSIAKGK